MTNRHCINCGGEYLEQNMTHLEDGAMLCMTCYDVVMLEYMKRPVSLTDVFRMQAETLAYTNKITSFVSQLRRYALLLKAPAREIIRRYISDEEDYCIKAFEKERHCITKREHELVMHMAQVALEGRQLGVVTFPQNDGRDQADALEAYMQGFTWYEDHKKMLITNHFSVVNNKQHNEEVVINA